MTSRFVAGLLVFSFSTLLAGESAPKLRELWSTSSGTLNPESAFYHPDTKLIYVSNVAGGATDADHQGWINVLSREGKVIKEKWVEGLNAPKGIGADNKTLWVSDIDRLVAIELTTGKKLSVVMVAGAKFLNDVAVADNGDVFVSDMFTGIIHRARSGKSEVFFQGPEVSHPNGLFVDGKKLVVATWGKGMDDSFKTKEPGTLVYIDIATGTAKPSPLAPFGNLDGIEMRAGGKGWIISDWMAGKVYTWDSRSTTAKLVLEGLEGAADIGYLPDTDIVIVPEMNKSTVHAYQL